MENGCWSKEREAWLFCLIDFAMVKLYLPQWNNPCFIPVHELWGQRKARHLNCVLCLGNSVSSQCIRESIGIASLAIKDIITWKMRKLWGCRDITVPSSYNSPHSWSREEGCTAWGETELFWVLFVIKIMFFDEKLNELNVPNCPFKEQLRLSETLPVICT